MICGFEALVRWQHPRHGTISPDNFISLAEDTGLIYAIDNLVLEDAARRSSTGSPCSANNSPRNLP